MSLAFYFIGEPQLYYLLALSIVWNYIFGITTSRSNNNALYALGIIGNISLLLYYKYFFLIIKSLFLDSVLTEYNEDSIALPVGISFFTFQGISYLIDVKRNKKLAELNFIKVGLYISFFPQLIAGPILKFNEITAYLSKRNITTKGITQGSYRLIRGLAKKVILANCFAQIADYVFQSDISTLPTAVAWIGILFYTLQIYYDFSGYSDMAIGLGQIMGFKIPENFNYPYISKSIQEFWRRWHISLSTWFRDYLYIPLGGNRKGNTRLYMNLLIVFFLTGLWHGASYNFILWGLFHGLFLLIERITKGRISKNIPAFFKISYTLLVVITAWVFFRLDNMDSLFIYLTKMYSYHPNGDYSSLLQITPYALFLFLVGILFASPIFNSIYKKHILNSTNIFKLSAFNLTHILLFFYTLSELSASTYQSFIYFKF